MSDPIFFHRPESFDAIPDQRDGEHYWLVIAGYHITDPKAELQQLDQENIVTIVGPGCFYCEQRYSAKLDLRRCKKVKHAAD